MATLAGQLGKPGPRARFEQRPRARARYGVTSAAIAGDSGRARVRGRARSTRKPSANQLSAAPPSNGRRNYSYIAGNNGYGGGELRNMAMSTTRRAIERGKRSGWSATSPRRRSGARRGTGRLDGDAIGDEARRRSCGDSTRATRCGHPRNHGSAET